MNLVDVQNSFICVSKTSLQSDIWISSGEVLVFSLRIVYNISIFIIAIQFR